MQQEGKLSINYKGTPIKLSADLYRQYICPYITMLLPLYIYIVNIYAPI